jgi:NADH:ubiquinone oxidoreductase subunit 5 (subunit L)/multisubunit Na+/H+ antiporter MnhA subunit
MLLTILILPFIGAFTAGFLGRKLGVKGAHLLTCTCVLLAAFLATIAFYEVGIAGSPVYVHLCT